MAFVKRFLYWGALLISDIVVIYISFRISYGVRFFFNPFLNIFPVTKGIPSWEIYAAILKLAIPLWILVFIIFGKLYSKTSQDAANEFLAIVKSVFLATLLMFSTTFLYRQYEYSRLMFLLGFFFSIFMLFIFRETIKFVFGFIARKTTLQETVIVLGDGKSTKTAIRLLQKDPHKTILVYSASEIGKAKSTLISGHFQGELLVSGQLIDRDDLQELLDLCEDNGVEIKILPELLEMRLGEIRVDYSLGIPIFHLKPLSLHGFGYFVKRFFDVSVSILAVSIGFFPFLIISLLIRCDSPGSVFFRQERVGHKEKRFRCLKFRTMYENAEKLLEDLNLQSFRGGPAFKMRGDPRVTRVGKLLRRFSLDEFPQIWNVLKGDMSLIGPRPQVLKEANGNPEWAKKRFRVLPGITGLWQVSGRADLSYEDMMRLDIFYLENWTPGLDLRILLKTIPVMLSGRGAY